MNTEPRLEQRGERPYVAVRRRVPMPFGDLLPPLWNEVLVWLAGHGLEPAGPPFVRYLTTDMANKLDIEAGYPVAAPMAAPVSERSADHISKGTLPAGCYAVLVHTGPYQGLRAATAALLGWAKANGITWKTSTHDNAEWWAGRVEWYLTDPSCQPDPQKWQTELAFLAAEDGAA